MFITGTYVLHYPNLDPEFVSVVTEEEGIALYERVTTAPYPTLVRRYRRV